MNLKVRAAADGRKIIKNKTTGFGVDIKITSPSLVVGNLIGFTTDIGQLIDPDTGVAVSGRFASVTLNITDLSDAGLGIPVSVADKDSPPWIVEFDDVNLNSYKFKVFKSMPDRAHNSVSCIVEFYK